MATTYKELLKKADQYYDEGETAKAITALQMAIYKLKTPEGE